jgi:hypothetical protein
MSDQFNALSLPSMSGRHGAKFKAKTFDTRSLPHLVHNRVIIALKLSVLHTAIFTTRTFPAPECYGE